MWCRPPTLLSLFDLHTLWEICRWVEAVCPACPPVCVRVTGGFPLTKLEYNVLRTRVSFKRSPPPLRPWPPFWRQLVLLSSWDPVV